LDEGHDPSVTSSGKVAGHGGRIDVNAFGGTLDDLVALTGPRQP
jgi:hypothetical protein